VLNRHSAFDAKGIYRVLKEGGIFFTQQVGGDNLEDLIQEFGAAPRFKNWSLSRARQGLENVGFSIIQGEEWSGKMGFKDVGAIVYFLKAIPWIVDGFSVDSHLSVLERLQEKLNRGEKLVFKKTRFLIQARKPSVVKALN
jgi:hypothetical protein